MKHYVKLFFKSVGTVCVCALLGGVLLLTTFSIPTDRIEKNVAASAATFAEEGPYPELYVVRRSLLDNITDAIMLLNAAYSDDSSVLERAIEVNRLTVEGESSVGTLVAHYADGKGGTAVSYARYWHGYLVVLKPLLYFITYDQIRMLNFFFVFAMATVLIAVMCRKKLGIYSIPYIISLFLIDPFAISKSLQYSSVYYIYTIASIVLILAKDYLDKSIDRLVIFFVLTGCVTSYMDFLTAPLLTFGIPATFYLCMSKKSVKDTAKTLVYILTAWGFGYIGMWAGKWILGTLLGNTNIIMDAVEQVLNRMSTHDDGGVSFTFLGTLRRQAYNYKNPMSVVTAVYFLIAGVHFFRHDPKERLHDMKWTLYLAVCLLPVLWCLVVSNHSYVHHFFTFRMFMISAFSGMCLITSYAVKADTLTLDEPAP
ncbi:MAG: hypothetical protein LIO67_10460 [Lachnospiraceae bacterium]|nr:hypothetical protein [Lachnospiraceae bacterium]